MPPGIASVIEELVLAALISEKMLAHRKFRTDMALTALSVLLAGAGVFFIALAVERRLGSSYPPDVAALIASGIAFAAAVLAALFSWRRYGRRRLSLATARAELGGNIRALIDDVCRELDGPVRDNPKTAVLIAALTGFFLSNGVRMRG